MTDDQSPTAVNIKCGLIKLVVDGALLFPIALINCEPARKGEKLRLVGCVAESLSLDATRLLRSGVFPGKSAKREFLKSVIYSELSFADRENS